MLKRQLHVSFMIPIFNITVGIMHLQEIENAYLVVLILMFKIMLNQYG